MTDLAGTVLERDGAAYRVATASGELRAVLSGRTKLDAPRVVVGDRVTLLPDAAGGLATIIDVAPRKSLLERRIPVDVRPGLPLVAAGADILFMPGFAVESPPGPSFVSLEVVE